jgi:outer membrane lipoprotein
MKTQVRILGPIFMVMISLAGCAPVISEGIRMQVVRGISFKEVFQNPEAYQGKVVLWSGVIVAGRNQKAGTLLEVLEKPADSQGRPKDVDQSEGRFLAIYDGFLDLAIYSQGREVTIAGEIEGKRVLPLGEMEYTYPLLSIKEIYLWKTREQSYPYPYPYGYYPWWGYPPYRGYWLW